MAPVRTARQRRATAADLADPTKQTEPGDPAKPTELAKSAPPGEPTELTKPGDPAKPTELAKHTKHTKPAEAPSVSERTIYRDINAPLAVGVPLWTEQSRAGGVRLMDGWRTRLDGLAGKEAAAIFAVGVPDVVAGRLNGPFNRPGGPPGSSLRAGTDGFRAPWAGCPQPGGRRPERPGRGS
ncbi:hypothetical protein [Actinophytocola sp.]|uniref:hypothetical protein n=1 Tax=Actinophytocola sp. TaxID=1872138 RepID=UPI003D6B1B2E